MSTWKSCFTASVALFSVGLGCGGGGDGVMDPDPNLVASVSVSPSSATVNVGSSTTLQASARNSAGDVVATTITWSSSASGTASVSGSGLVTGVAAGTATITAAAGGRTASATVTVSDPSPPAAPTGALSTPISDTQIRVTWTDNSSNETGFVIEREAVGADVATRILVPVTVASAFAQAGTTGPNITTFTDEGLQPGTEYRHRVLGCNANGCSAPSSQTPPVTTLNQPVLTIRKVIQSSSGGTPDNPANPSLAGFAFQVRLPGTSTVIATLSTNSSGMASATLPGGTYDIRETNAQGLSDVTQAVDGRAVVAGQTNSLDWINRQAELPPNPGMITVQKTIQSSTGAAPDNPPNPSLAGFVFEVRQAGTSTVRGAGTTDASGQAVISLAPGSYDVFETSAQGLTDFTQLAAGVGVTSGGNTSVGWVNRQAVPVTGTLTIMKTVQGKDGGVPVQPFTLEGYEFEVRTGTSTVVAQLTTDATGKAVATLPAGTYTVVEDDAQLLADISGPLGTGNNVTVTAGQDTPLNWINRQQHLVGMLRYPNQRFIARLVDAPFTALRFASLSGAIPPLYAGALGNGNVLTVDFIPAGPDNVQVAERNPVTGAIIRTWTEDIRSLGPDACYRLACLATLQNAQALKEIWRLDPFTSAWTMFAAGRDAAIFEGPNGETSLWFDETTGALLKHEAGAGPGSGNVAAPAVSGVQVSGLAPGFTYYEPSVCPGGGTLLLRRVPNAAQQVNDIVAYDLNLASASLSNERVLTTDGGSHFPVCFDATGPQPMFFFQRIINQVGMIWKHAANGAETSLGDPAEFRPFRWR